MATLLVAATEPPTVLHGHPVETNMGHDDISDIPCKTPPTTTPIESVKLDQTTSETAQESKVQTSNENVDEEVKKPASSSAAPNATEGSVECPNSSSSSSSNSNDNSNDNSGSSCSGTNSGNGSPKTASPTVAPGGQAVAFSVGPLSPRPRPPKLAPRKRKLSGKQSYNARRAQVHRLDYRREKRYTG